MRLRFVIPPYDGIANTFGYSVMVAAMAEALPQCGAIFDDTAPLALHLEPPIKYAKIPGTTSAIFTMWESEWEFPEKFRRRLHEADLVIVPCRWNVPIFEAVTDAPVVVCPLGIDTATYRYVPRTWDRKTPFQWLFVGAPNARKGYDSIQQAWNQHFYGRAGCRLYFKTSGGSPDAESYAVKMEGWEPTATPLVVTRGNVTLDMRRLPVADLVRLYAASHGFLYPTGGEGFGLTLAEALATGLPSLATDLGGHKEFCDRDTVTLLPWRPVDSYLTTWDEASGDEIARDQLTSAFVEPDDLATAMADVMVHYRAAVRQGRRASQRVRQFTWQRSATRLLRILTEHVPAARAA